MNQTELSRIAIITDTNSGITQEEAAQLGIFLLPMPFFIQDELFLEGKTLSQKSLRGTGCWKGYFYFSAFSCKSYGTLGIYIIIT